MDNQVNPNSTKSSFCLPSVFRDEYKHVVKYGGRKLKRATATYIFMYFIFKWRSGAWGDSLIHLPLRLQPAASSTCSDTANHSASHGRGVDGAHPCGRTQCAACASSASVLSAFCVLIRKPRETTAVLRLTQLARKEFICFTNQQGKLQVQGCSIDSDVKSVALLPSPLPHILLTSVDILFWYQISLLNNYLVFIRHIVIL